MDCDDRQLAIVPWPSLRRERPGTSSCHLIPLPINEIYRYFAVFKEIHPPCFLIDGNSLALDGGFHNKGKPIYNLHDMVL